ncbi:helix-turn-helix domain-containing protein [Herbaspirillum seropedicae]|uniref:helix-turn-helix domain-containing protein n=1 Tax=Herbaspirillum seropedicae TaxID=964 RepID=UPI003FCE1A34
MYISDEKLKLLEQIMWGLNTCNSSVEVRDFVSTRLLKLLDADYFASYTWDDDNHRFGNTVSVNMDPANLANYERYYQYCDPITLELQRLSVPTLVSQVMPMEQLRRTEFFNDFLARDGLCFGVNMFAYDGDRNIGDIRIWRSARRENFDRDALKLLALVRPAFTLALQRARAHCSAAVASPDAGALLTPTPLSERESHLAQCICRGLSDKEIARELHIEFSTVRTHITRIFKKLNVGNRTQLVKRLIDGR